MLTTQSILAEVIKENNVNLPAAEMAKSPWDYEKREAGESENQFTAKISR